MSTVIIPFAALLLLNGKILLGLKKVKHRLQTHHRSSRRPVGNRFKELPAAPGGPGIGQRAASTVVVNDCEVTTFIARKETEVVFRRISGQSNQSGGGVEQKSPPTEQGTPLSNRNDMEMKEMMIAKPDVAAPPAAVDPQKTQESQQEDQKTRKEDSEGSPQSQKGSNHVGFKLTNNTGT